MVMDTGAAEVHFRIASPPTMVLFLRRRHARAREAHRRTDERRADPRYLGVDSLKFISLDGLYRACGEEGARCRRATILRCLLLRRLSGASSDMIDRLPAQVSA